MKKKTVINWIWQIALAILIVGLDRITKSNIISQYLPGEVFGEIPYIADLIYVRNTGAAFSVMSENTAILSVISVVFLIALVIYKIVKKPDGFMHNLSVVLFFSGALGNAIDRIAYKYVVDFIDIKWFEFPVFNIADIAIVLGAVAAMVYVIFFDKSEEKSK